MNKKEIKRINDLIEEALLHASGITPLEPTDTSGYKLEDFDREIKRLRQQIETNMNAFTVPKIKVKNVKKTRA